MNVRTPLQLLLFFFLFYSQQGYSQYIVNGTAKKVSCNCYTITEEQMFQSGSVWNSNKISLDNSFDFWFNVFLGCKNADGADGIVFILQPNSTSVGTAGAGMGFDGVRPSIGIALDTWQNFDVNDPSYDHISIQANGNINHNADLAGPVPVSAASDNVEDCQWHVLRIAWDAGTQNLSAYFDGVLRVEKKVDLVSTIFNGDPNVFWGFTGATGGSVNLQQFCTALNPLFRLNSTFMGGCVGEPVLFRDSSVSFAPILSYNWAFGDGTSSTDKSPPPHTYSAPGTYPVNLKIRGQDGCENDSTVNVTIGTAPTGSLSVYDTCFRFSPRYQLAGTTTGVSYQWLLDGSPVSTDLQPVLPPTSTGRHRLQTTITSLFGCGNPLELAGDFTIKPAPQIAASVQDGCVDKTIAFNGLQTDNATTVSAWQWNFGDGSGANTAQAVHQYSTANQYDVKVWAAATNGCVSDTVVEKVRINAAIVYAGEDTSVIKDFPFQLHGTGNGAFLWTPSAGLSDPTAADPVVTLSRDQRFILFVTTAEGCVASDSVVVKTFNGPAIYVPSGFTPNGDGKNEILRPVFIGIKELKQFAVFNRWGERMFSTNNMQTGWEGKNATPGVYVWMISAVNSLGQPLTLKGTVTLIR